MMNKKMLLFLVALIYLASPVPYGDCKGKKVEGKSGKLSLEEQDKADGDDTDIRIAPPPPPLKFFNLPSFSLTTGDAEPHFVKMTIVLGYEDNKDLSGELITKKDQIVHIINILTRGKTCDELNSVTGKITLAEEIKAHVNILLISGKIKEIYFKEFIIN